MKSWPLKTLVPSAGLPTYHLILSWGSLQTSCLFMDQGLQPPFCLFLLKGSKPLHILLCYRQPWLCIQYITLNCVSSSPPFSLSDLFQSQLYESNDLITNIREHGSCLFHFRTKYSRLVFANFRLTSVKLMVRRNHCHRCLTPLLLLSVESRLVALFTCWYIKIHNLLSGGGHSFYQYEYSHLCWALIHHIDHNNDATLVADIM